jgi:SAM-dependent methyltransferase
MNTQVDTKVPPVRARRTFSKRKQRTLEQADHLIDLHAAWKERHRFYYEDETRTMRFLVPKGLRVLELGSGSGGLLAALEPSEGTGVDFSQAAVEKAAALHPSLTFIKGDVETLDEIPGLHGQFDIIVMSDTIGALDDCIETFKHFHRYCQSDTRIIVSYHTRLWEPLLLLYARLRTGRLWRPSNWLSSQDIANLFELTDFDVIKREWRMLCPFRLLGVGRLLNRFVATLPLLRKLCLRNYVVARPRPRKPLGGLSTTVVVPCRNESGNIEAAVRRIPEFCSDIEIIFVEGGSSDGTWEEIQRCIAAYPERDIKAFKQSGTGKGDAVRTGFAQARGEVLMILDADLTMPPEDLPKFYNALITGKGEFINGSRLVYPRDRQAMRVLNLFANYLFAAAFTYLLNQRHTDTLCGTKVLLRRHYDEISRNRAYFGNFDPFGDFDLIFGAAKLNLKTAEVPIRYTAREYGQTNISRFRNGWLLLRMVGLAFMKLKAL